MRLYYVALGSNLGDRLEYLRQGISKILEQTQARNLRRSRVYDTDPVGVPSEQPPYLNAAVSFESPLEPAELLEVLLQIEQQLHRKRLYRNSPRTLDLDLLLADQEIIRLAKLEIPHPRMHERAFVMAPLADLDPDLKIPGFEQTVGEQLRGLDDQAIRATDLEL